MAGPRAIFVDAFGTIIDATPAWIDKRDDCIRYSLESCGVAPDVLFPYYEEERLRDHERAPADLREFDFPARFARTLRHGGLTEKEARIRGAEAALRYFDYQGKLIGALPDARDGLEELGRMAPLILVSNYPHTPALQRALDRVGLSRYFRGSVVSADVGFLKPHPSLFEEAMKIAGVGPAECAMVGNDAYADVGGAHRLGIASVLVAFPRGSEHTVPEGALGVAADLPEAAALIRDRWPSARR